MTRNDNTDFYRGRNILVTGGAGAVGGSLARVLGELGAIVTVLDDFSSAERWNSSTGKHLRLVEGDLLDPPVLENAFADCPAVVFHLAAFFANQNSIEHPEDDLMVNGMGVLRVLLAAEKLNNMRVVFASSGSAFKDANSPLPLSEDYVTVHLSTPYQVTKMLGELYCNYFHDSRRAETVRVRFFNSYGPGEIPSVYRNVIPNFFYRALQGHSLQITGDGGETRDFTFVDDIVNGLLRAGSAPDAAGEAFNLGSGQETRIDDLADMINGICKNKAEIEFLPRREWDVEDRRVASVEKASRVLGYHASTKLEDGLARTFEWFQDNWDNICRSANFAE